MNASRLWLLSALLISLPLHADNPRESVIRTIAGTADDNVLGSEFSFGGLSGLATDSSGNTFFTIQALSRVYRIGTDGRVIPYAGNGVSGEYRDDVAATDSPLSRPASLVDAAGNLYIAVASALLRVDAGSHIASTVFKTPYRAPDSSIGIAGVGRMAIGPTGLLYFCDGYRIMSYSFQSGSLSVVGGNGSAGVTRAGVMATSTPLQYPQSLAVGADGTVYFSALEPAVYRVGQNGILEHIPTCLISEWMLRRKRTGQRSYGPIHRPRLEISQQKDGMPAFATGTTRRTLPPSGAESNRATCRIEWARE